jgi:hypothetical protein
VDFAISQIRIVMSLKPAHTELRSPTGKLSSMPAIVGQGLLLPHERDESTSSVADQPDSVMKQAKRDIDGGLVDTDMRATPGLDANLRTRLVAGPGGKPLLTLNASRRTRGETKGGGAMPKN